MSSAPWRDFDQAIADEICDEIASSSCGLKKLIAQNPHWPCDVTIYKWLKKNDGFARQYARAKEAQITVLTEEILEISDTIGEDNKFNDRVGRDRLRVDSRKWLAGKLVPKVYGDRVSMAGVKDEPIEFENVTPEDAKKRLAELAAMATSRATDDKPSSE